MSSFFERKIRTLYSRFDVDGSGFIDVADFKLWGERLVAYGNKYISRLNIILNNFNNNVIDKKNLEKAAQV